MPAPTRVQEILSLPELMRNVESYITRRYIQGVREERWVPFEQALWQRNYYEQVIRNEESLGKIREYILNNSLQRVFNENLTISCNLFIF